MCEDRQLSGHPSPGGNHNNRHGGEVRDELERTSGPWTPRGPVGDSLKAIVTEPKMVFPIPLTALPVYHPDHEVYTMFVHGQLGRGATTRSTWRHSELEPLRPDLRGDGQLPSRLRPHGSPDIDAAISAGAGPMVHRLEQRQLGPAHLVRLLGARSQQEGRDSPNVRRSADR